MAQLPPRAPTVMTQNWHPFSHHHHHQKLPNFPAPAANNQQPSWMDEFLDFSSVKRGSHRRSASDSIAFLEIPFGEECQNSSTTSSTNNHHMAAEEEEEANGFDRIDDEQLMSMFSDDMGLTPPPPPPPPPMSNPSTPSDQNSNNDDQQKPTPSDLDQPQTKTEPGEVESSCQLFLESQANQQQSLNYNSNGDLVIDPKRVKRILANRQSAQRSRVRKLQYISELERSVTSLQSEVSALSPRVSFLDHQRLILNVDNSALKQRIAALAQDKIFKDAHQEALKKEIERLRQIYQQQQSMKKIINSSNNNNATTPTAANGGGTQATAAEQPQPMDCTEKEEEHLN
ncbi:basic leucine zipper 6-like [Rutidosis leptorrhynchoides]|uniref:basic leucine zipper 6-like n=1 Tax=Rutidosis leptorrhynchoides TaxID=125765 RepID=UPI003A99D202